MEVAALTWSLGYTVCCRVSIVPEMTYMAVGLAMALAVQHFRNASIRLTWVAIVGPLSLVFRYDLAQAVPPAISPPLKAAATVHRPSQTTVRTIPDDEPLQYTLYSDSPRPRAKIKEYVLQ